MATAAVTVGDKMRVCYFYPAALLALFLLHLFITDHAFAAASLKQEFLEDTEEGCKEEYLR